MLDRFRQRFHLTLGPDEIIVQASPGGEVRERTTVRAQDGELAALGDRVDEPGAEGTTVRLLHPPSDASDLRWLDQPLLAVFLHYHRMAQPARRKQLVGFVGWLGVGFIAAAIGGAASIRAGTFYTQLVRPDWAPPPSIFGPVWTVLYALMGVAAWLVWRVGGFRAAGSALTLFLVQLAFNALWSWLFFAWHHGALAFADILLLWVLIVATVVAFWRVRPWAGVLLVPYLLWVSFATALNYAVWQLNPQLLG